MSSKTFRATIVRDGSICFVPLTFDPRSVFGKVRVPVKVTLNGYTYRRTIAAMGGPPFVPLRKSHREAAGVEGGAALVELRDAAANTEHPLGNPPLVVLTRGSANPRLRAFHASRAQQSTAGRQVIVDVPRKKFL